MSGYNDYLNVDQESEPVTVRNIMPGYPVARPSYGNDVEVINLDDRRDNIKPTTWH